MKLIGIGGRKQSGKTVLSSAIHDKLGYHKLAMADSLKDLICSLLSINRKEMETYKNTDKDYNFSFNEDRLTLLSNEINVGKDKIEETVEGKTYHTIRDMLQLIGTELIRRFNQGWHVNKTREKINSLLNEYGNDVKIVIDDIRFPNEINLVNEFEGTLYFIIRPNNWDVSNHASENSIQWFDLHDKSNIIINDCTKEALEEEFVNAIETGRKNEKYFLFNLENKKYAGDSFAFLCHRMQFEYLNDATKFLSGYMIASTHNISEYGRFSNIDDETGLITFRTTSKMVLDSFCNTVDCWNYITREYKGNLFVYEMVIYNPFIVENLKMYI